MPKGLKGRKGHRKMSARGDFEQATNGARGHALPGQATYLAGRGPQPRVCANPSPQNSAGGDEKLPPIDPKTDLTPKKQLTSFSALMCHVQVVTLAGILVVVPDAVVACRT